MGIDQKQFSLLERCVVVAIILIVSSIAIQNVLHSVKTSERRTLNKAATQYEAVKSMYEEQRQTAPTGNATGTATGSAGILSTPTR
jgi:type II secretory pathway pseudopilin PulG